jgi:hypothetical protein
MALLECQYYLLMATAIGNAFASSRSLLSAYIGAIIPALMLIGIIQAIPLSLNWSDNLYGHLVKRFVGFVFFVIILYAIIYHGVGIMTSSGVRSDSFRDAVYFSATTYSTVGYGDFVASPDARLITSCEAILGLFTMPIGAALIWLYCQSRLWDKSLERQAIPAGFTVHHDIVTGVWREVENERVKSEQQARNEKFPLNPCRKCGNKNLEIEKYYSIMGRTAPLPKFMVFCKCGNSTKGHLHAYITAQVWNRFNRQPKKAADNT